MTNHYELYFNLLNTDHFPLLQKLMKEQKVYESLDAEESTLEEIDGFPYILFNVKTKEIFAAQMIGLLMDIHVIFPEYLDRFYLPVIAMATGYNENINKLINKNNSIRHEIAHIKDIIKLIDNTANSEFSYVSRISKYGINKLENPEYLSESIDIEVFKIFYLEPKALSLDFGCGERMIMAQFLGKILEYECATEEEFIRTKILDYLTFISGRLTEKFPDSTIHIKQLMDASIQKYGQDVFGKFPLECLKNVRNATGKNMLASILTPIKKR